jgi:predicted transcriptional regulator
MEKLHLITLADLKERRELVGITQRELAKRSGMSQAMVARMENNDANPTINTLKKIVNTLNGVQE